MFALFTNESFQGSSSRSRWAWDRAIDRFDPPVERLTIPFEDTSLPGYFVRAADTRGA
jgi:hypothetical protein